MAKPGERWAPSDALSAADPQARRRLVWIAQDATLTVVHYEQGGIAHSYHIAVLQRDPVNAKPSIVWSARGPRAEDYAQFVHALDWGAYTD